MMAVQFLAAQPAGNSEIPSGTYRQLKKSVVHLSDLYYDPVYFKRGKVPGTEQWFVDPLDEVDPVYKFYFVNRPPDGKEVNSVFVGQLISPTGKIYDLQHVDYEKSTRVLTFSSKKGEHIKYDGKIQFRTDKLDVGDVKLKASGDFGTVEMEFQVSVWALE